MKTIFRFTFKNFSKLYRIFPPTDTDKRFPLRQFSRNKQILYPELGEHPRKAYPSSDRVEAYRNSKYFHLRDY